MTILVSMGLRKPTCLPWTQGISGCIHKTGSQNYVDLDPSMPVSDRESCSSLCKQQNRNGCCALDDTYGCYWLKDGIPFLPFLQTSVQCSSTGMFVAVSIVSYCISLSIETNMIRHLRIKCSNT